MRNRLPKMPYKKECGIINMDNDSGPGTHWVAYYKDDNIIEYYDSFGNLQPPLEILYYLGPNITYNYKRDQHFNTYNCGHLCLKFLIEKAYKYKI